jgi:hypothetical protein
MPALAAAADLSDAFNIDPSIADAGDDLSTITVSQPSRWWALDYADVSDVDHSCSDSYTSGDEFTLGDPLTLDRPDFAHFQRLAAQLGGLSIDICTYEARFGPVTDESPFDGGVWHGLSGLYGAYPHHDASYTTVTWLGYVISAELCSESTAASPVSAAAS